MCEFGYYLDTNVLLCSPCADICDPARSLGDQCSLYCKDYVPATSTVSTPLPAPQTLHSSLLIVCATLLSSILIFVIFLIIIKSRALSRKKGSFLQDHQISQLPPVNDAVAAESVTQETSISQSSSMHSKAYCGESAETAVKSSSALSEISQSVLCHEPCDRRMTSLRQSTRNRQLTAVANGQVTQVITCETSLVVQCTEKAIGESALLLGGKNYVNSSSSSSEIVALQEVYPSIESDDRVCQNESARNMNERR